jgi:hypothetical protein
MSMFIKSDPVDLQHLFLWFLVKSISSRLFVDPESLGMGPGSTCSSGLPDVSYVPATEELLQQLVTGENGEYCDIKLTSVWYRRCGSKKSHQI